MYWEVHWNAMVERHDEYVMDEDETYDTFDHYEDAFALFCTLMRNEDGMTARCWMTVHTDREPHGNVMAAYSARWEDNIRIWD